MLFRRFCTVRFCYCYCYCFHFIFKKYLYFLFYSNKTFVLQFKYNLLCSSISPFGRRMDKPTCPNELRNEIVIVDLTAVQPASPEAEASEPPAASCSAVEGGNQLATAAGSSKYSYQGGLVLGRKYLQGSVKPSTLSQVCSCSKQ